MLGISRRCSISYQDGQTASLSTAARDWCMLSPDDRTHSSSSTKRQEEQLRQQRAHALGIYRDKPTLDADGRQYQLYANIGGVSGRPVRRWTAGAEGIGLFRTEFLFMDRPNLPGLRRSSTTPIAEVSEHHGGQGGHHPHSGRRRR